MDLDHAACYRAICVRDPRFDGRFFTGVKTTLVYCRPICPAKTPQSENVTFFPTAAAAHEAGFYPCLRCRPETAPYMGAWRGTSNSVSRGLALIELGVLDEVGVDALAGRLGLGERQLRRLFRQHLGASPIAVAQARRVLLAKQLIHETQLPMSEIAFAAGFGSIRRFNETFSTLFGRAPGELRDASKPDLPAGPRGEISLLLPYCPPYDWPATLELLRRRAIAGVEIVTADRYARSLDLDGSQGTIAVQQSDGNALRATVRFPKLSALPTIIARLRRVFDLAADPVAIIDHLGKDPALAPLVKSRPGLRVPGAWDGFELAIRAVVTQEMSVPAARQLIERMVGAYGERLAEPENGLRLLFPRPEQLTTADLASLGMPQNCAAALSAVAVAAISDPHLFDATCDFDDALRGLLSIRGVEESTAEDIAFRQLREPDAFPAHDPGLIRAMASQEGRGYSPSEFLARANAWRPWRAYAAQHLLASPRGRAIDEGTSSYRGTERP